MHGISHNKLQQSFQGMFSLVKERHNRVTRQATDNKLSLALVQTNYGKRFITSFGVKTWNNIPKDIRSLDSKRAFSTKYFAHLHSQYKNLNELKEIVVCAWQFFVDQGLRAGIVEALYLETECFWHFFPLWLVILVQNCYQRRLSLLPNALMEFGHLTICWDPSLYLHTFNSYYLTYFLFVFVPPGSV